MTLSPTLKNLSNPGSNDDTLENLATIEAWGTAVNRLYVTCEQAGFDLDDLLRVAA